MFLIRLFWLLLLGLLGRRFYLSWKASREASRTRVSPTSPAEKSDTAPLTDQDISDADFEEIP